MKSYGRDIINAVGAEVDRIEAEIQGCVLGCPVAAAALQHHMRFCMPHNLALSVTNAFPYLSVLSIETVNRLASGHAL
eukprot:1159041-Pelagomonas_calceolata.AAC.9